MAYSTKGKRLRRKEVSSVKASERPKVLQFYFNLEIKS
jgi:hypothetical protein